MPESVTDGDLIAALGAGGDVARQAWSMLVPRHSPKMWAVARSFAIDAQTAEDLVQTAWLRLLSRADQLRDPQAVGPWLCMIVRNEARRLTTRRREIPAEAPIEHRPAVVDAPDARLLRAERDRAVRLAFSRLGPECRQLLQLLLADPPLSYDEIAAALDRPRGSLGPSRRRCLQRLRDQLPPGYES
ncbi:RNA polymerase sigma factor [Actinoplanes friuliensis]|uniref:ECF subfamily RNA polymerase sigma-24 subunit n=1 Tax=Actinoplanes friuliensis DSM 7358 TaxID=1246995 RepID=U5VSW2_9ACTN|nr:sigma-70 family RNA polymerase sigma factor [Actinoplanes friuliensis]AGZ39959.1 ECF subfamily RNA polymerase sigma-24 subunit [Actinoplanes friuliensis DSM 7358]